MSTRLLCLGIDALDKEFVLDWAGAGILPAFRRLLETTAWGVTDSPPGLFVGAVWPSFWTSVTPARHARYCYRQIRPGSYEHAPVRSTDTRAPAFWTGLSAAGKRVAIIDVPKPASRSGHPGTRPGDRRRHIYTRRFGGDRVSARDVLHVEEGNPSATVIGDLTSADHIPTDAFDCIILTQTLPRGSHGNGVSYNLAMANRSSVEPAAGVPRQDTAPAMEAGTPPHTQVTIRIEPLTGWAPLNLNELWEYRELLFFLVWRDIKVRYKQTVLGASWAIIQPFFMMVVFSLFFGRLAKVPSDGIPYPIFAYAALVPWTFFANGLSHASNSLVGSGNLVKKVYFPRLAIPLAAVLSGVVDFALAFVVLLGMMVYFGMGVSIKLLVVPPLLLLAFVTALGVALWLSALNVRYRDVRHAVPFLTQLWLFSTPVAYPSSLLPEPWRTVYGVNPMVGVVEGFRWALLGVDTAPGPILAVSCLAAIAVLVGGAFHFRRLEKTFADVI